TLACVSVWGLFVTFNLIGAAGHVALNRSDAISERVHQASIAKSLEIDIAAHEKTLATKPADIRAVKTIDVDLRFYERSPTFKATKECTEAKTRNHRRFCAQHDKVNKERQEAIKYLTAEEDLKLLKKE